MKQYTSLVKYHTAATQMNYDNAWELDQRLNIRTSRGVQGRSYEGHILVTIYYLELALATEESLAT